MSAAWVENVGGLLALSAFSCTLRAAFVSSREIRCTVTGSRHISRNFSLRQSKAYFSKDFEKSTFAPRTRCARWQPLHWPHRPLQQMRERGRASPANVKSGWPGPIPKCHTCIGPPQRPRPARTCARTIARTTARTHAHARPQTWPGAFAQMSARFHPRYACMRARDGG